MCFCPCSSLEDTRLISRPTWLFIERLSEVKRAKPEFLEVLAIIRLSQGRDPDKV